MSDIIGPYKTGVDSMEILDTSTGEIWHIERRGGKWSYTGPDRGWSSGYPKSEAIARCKEAIKAAGGTARKPVRATGAETGAAPAKPGDKATQADRDYWKSLRALGCAVADEHCDGRLEIHHVRLVPGQRRKHRQVICLCAAHHREGGHGVAFHAGRDAWEEHYMPMAELLEQTRFAVAEMALIGAEEATAR
ncbi:MAG: hypothetical protein KDK70_39360 [Myxococcales bacterium]|nr:hypothetical protein [Myxococcales bacterium]